MRDEVTFFGVVRRVVGARVHVEISPDVPSASPIINGRIYRLGQVGSFVRIPLGFLNLYGIVSTVGASEGEPSNAVESEPFHGLRWVEVQLVGESYGSAGFQRGVSVFPTLDDRVHIVTDDDLSIIFGSSGPSMVEIGTLAASESLPAMINLDRLVTRHGAIIGSTGSGKSNTIAGLLKAFTEGGFPSARIAVIDPHGEYATALAGRAQVFSIGSKKNPLRVPYWALSFDELAWFLVDRRTASESLQDLALRDFVFDRRRANAAKLRAGSLLPDDMTVDSPIPFSIREVWYHFDRKERVTYNDMGRTQEALEAEGDASSLKPASFKPPGAGAAAPFKAQQPAFMSNYVNKILARLKDKRFDFLLNDGDYDGKKKDLNDLLREWIDHEHPITVFDLGGVPFEVIDLVVGVMTRILYEGMFWGRDMPGIGKQRPLLVVYEEAHGYLPKGSGGQFIAGYASRAVRRIFKEGRKYGVGSIVISQRPSELDETVLSQCGTFFALRLSNSDDQSRVKSTVPDSLAGLIDMLPALRTGEALVLGEAVHIPSRVRFPLVEPRPRSDDPETAKQWKKERVDNAPYDLAITAWRRQRTIEPVVKTEGKSDGKNSS
jgi:DNA helicase HerA-like ATPase